MGSLFWIRNIYSEVALDDSFLEAVAPVWSHAELLLSGKKAPCAEKVRHRVSEGHEGRQRVPAE